MRIRLAAKKRYEGNESEEMTYTISFDKIIKGRGGDLPGILGSWTRPSLLPLPFPSLLSPSLSL
jgi:hypothetical protein